MTPKLAPNCVVPLNPSARACGDTAPPVIVSDKLNGNVVVVVLIEPPVVKLIVPTGPEPIVTPSFCANTCHVFAADFMKYIVTLCGLPSESKICTVVLLWYVDGSSELKPAVVRLLTRESKFATTSACVVAFVLQAAAGTAGGQRLVYALGVIPAVLVGNHRLSPDLALVPPEVSVITSMFLHGGLLHLLGNLLYLWIFGNNVEDAMGRARFLAFYLACGIAAVLAQALPDPQSTVPMVGASGAISGVLGAYMLLYPNARVLLGLPLGIFIVELGRYRAVWVLASWFAMQLLMNLSADRGGEGGVAFRAHIGGFVAGVLLVPFLKQRSVPLWGGVR